MKKELSPKAAFAVVAVVIVVLGGFLLRKVSNNDPTPRPNPKYFGVSTPPTPGH